MDSPPALPETVDWNRFVNLCEWHNVVPLVYRALPAACPGAIHPAAMNRLRNLCHNNTARTLFLTSELSRIQNALESCGVPAYPFKGPALSVMLYGDPARRQSNDLDILIPKEHVCRAMEVLDRLGYGAKNALKGPQLAAHRRTEYELQFFRRDRKLTVELQWAVVP
ncbi:MAG TPA: nucleotidyltransferase family protein, partial [Syntrophales bacterium]|nr:nucleotidyltransferase family protein [Syntrophales bacterium]